MSKSKESVLSEEQFRSSLARERAIADRNGHSFSVLTLQPSPTEDHKLADRLCGLSREELRVSDEIGWFDGKRVGILLPYTANSAAALVADRITRRVS